MPNFKQGAKRGAQGAGLGYAMTGTPMGAAIGGAAGGLFGSFFEGDPNAAQNSMADARARIEQLRREQYDQRKGNLEKTMSFFKPWNDELKNLYGVDMPTMAGLDPFKSGQVVNNYQPKPGFEPGGSMWAKPGAPAPELGAFDVGKAMPSPFAPVPPRRVGSPVTRRLTGGQQPFGYGQNDRAANAKKKGYG
jgi:hypothetical protein